MENCAIHGKDTGNFLENENKTKWVTIITLLTMIVEVSVGYWSGSMALLADGWHMASHAVALFLSLVVYYLYRHPKFKSSFTFGGGKILSLGGYTSSLLLIFIAGSMIVESLGRFYDERSIHYPEALGVAIFGLVINLVCAMILHQGHDLPHADEHVHGENCDHSKNKLSPIAPAHNHQHSHSHSHAHDHNHESAYVHILTDAFTSVLAIAALLLGMWQGWTWLDPAVGILGGVVVLRWAITLVRQSGMDLLDAHDGSIDRQNLVESLEKDGSQVLDIHLWKLSPGQVGCEIIIKKSSPEKSSSTYRSFIQKNFNIQHLIIEVI